MPKVLALARRVEADARAELLVVGAHRHLARLAVLDAGDRELLAAGEAERLAGSRRPGTGAAGCPSSGGSSGGCARTTPRSPRARRGGSAPSPPSRATSPSRTPCPRARSSARLRRGSARRRRRSVLSSPSGRCTVHVPSLPGDELVAQPDVRERAAHHHLVVAAPRAVRVELAPLDAVLDQVLPGGRVGPDRAGGRDVVGRDRVAEHDEHARAREIVRDRRRLARHAVEVRRQPHVRRVRIPREEIARPACRARASARRR